MLAEITVVITSCGRLELLKGTIDSFRNMNTYPIHEFILVDDSGDPQVHEELRKKYADFTLILESHRGQVQCIDDAYSRVSTPFLFHGEDDWCFTKEGFMEKSLKILQREPKIMLVWLNDPHLPIEEEIFHADDVEYRLVGSDAQNVWSGMTWNPHLQRMSEYELVKPYTQFLEGENSAVAECRAGIKLRELGFRAAKLNDDYCFHTGALDQKRIT